MDVALIIVTVLFVLALLWRVRPLLPLARKEERVALKVAKDRIESAKNHEARAAALCDAAELCAKRNRRASAEGYFLRALREAPSSPEVVTRAAEAMKRWPRTLDALLWRTLAAAPWAGEGERAAASKVALERLADLYEGPLRRRVHGRALRFALERLA